MPDYPVSPTAVVNQIKSNLQDRYEPGYPILKELLQNADDARSRRFKLDVCSGWSGADNPLLQGPGLLVINDGTFCDKDRQGILSFGESVKATDRATIGKFGLGQKAVFHLCDAFVVHVVGVNEPFSIVVNPFLNVEVADNVTPSWDNVNATDAALLVERAGQGFRDRALILWLPFRRNNLIPAPDAGFSTLRPDSNTIVNELARTDDLQVLLTALRHLESIEICSQGKMICSISLSNAQERLRGQHERPCTRSFHGTIDGPDASSKFVGREATTRDAGLDSLSRSDHWPKTISAVHAEPIREKGEQHGAVTLLRIGTAIPPSVLQISWAVFLPVSDAEEEPLPIDGFDVDRIHLLLHGYFFMDSGRRHIEGITDPANQEKPADPAALRRAWNTQLRDTVVLPLIPALLKDALDQGLMTATELTYLAAAVAKSPWFRDNRAAICKEHALTRVLQGPTFPPSGRVAWRLIPIDAKLRSLPAILTDSPKLVDRLFDHIGQWAQDQEITLCIDRSASLTAKPIQWTATELDSLFATLSPQAFQYEPLATLLTNLLKDAELNDDHRTMLAPRLVKAFRKAIVGPNRLAPSSNLKSILTDVPRDRLFALPVAVQRRAILRALASSNAEMLPVRSELLDEEDPVPPTEQDLTKLLIALAPMIEDNEIRLADQASTAALALLADHDISELAAQEDFRDIKIVRARNPIDGSIVVLSFAELFERSQQRFLFRRTPEVESRLGILVRALPRVQPLIVYTAVDRGTAIHRLTCTADRQVFFDLINRASIFGPEEDRARMVELLTSLEGDDDVDALRKLCAGSPSVGELRSADRFPELERIIKLLFQRRSHLFLVPSSIISVLTRTKMQEIGIRGLDTPGLEQLITDSIGVFPDLAPDESERKSLLKTDLSNYLLRRLPIHDRSDGTVDNATESFWEGTEWAVPCQLRERVSTVRLFNDPETRSRQKQVVPRWSPLAQIKTALLQEDDTHSYQEEILQAIEQLCREEIELPQELKECLRTTMWLGTANGTVAPKDVLMLPPSVAAAAKQHFRNSPAYITVHQLHEEIREHPGFRYVQERHVIPSQRASIDKLAKMIYNARLQGRLGSAEDYPIGPITELAKMGVDLKLPGWPLLAAVLIDSDHDVCAKVVACFHEVSEPESVMAGKHLDALAELADGDARPAAEAYRHGFRAVAQWAGAARSEVYGATRVPTKSGEWRNGSKVVAEGNGIAPGYVLADAYATMLPIRSEPLDDHGIDDTNGTDEERLDDYQKNSVEQHRRFLDNWRDLVPSELVAIYLGIAGRHNPLMEPYREKWIRDTTREIDHKVKMIEPTLFLIKEAAPQRVETIALSGDLFHAPLDDHASATLVVGNLHKVGKRYVLFPGHRRRTRIVTMQVRTSIHEALPVEDCVRVFREFVETAAAVCLSNDALDDVRQILDPAADIGQTTLKDTERLLRDRLPALLAALKLPPGSKAHGALRRYEGKELKAQPMPRDKDELWQSICDPTAAKELLAAVRARITDQGYRTSRVLFELFQNADDAYVQQDDNLDHTCFRVCFGVGEGGLRTVHWGRPINRGSNTEEARLHGYGRDLFNMLVMNFSEKRPGEGVTGKFGLGFKCVHLLSDSVGIASGFIVLRTVGGILPGPWPSGRLQAGNLSQPNRTATVIDVPYTETVMDGGRKAEQAFLKAMTWLPAFARRIRRIEVRGSEPGTVDCSVSTLPGTILIDIVTIHIRRQTQRALRIDLGNSYSLLLKIGAEGPECFEPSLGRIWNLAPLEEKVRSGWLLNGPFSVDPGRGRLAGEIDDRRAQFQDLGQTLGERLLELHDLMKVDWKTIASELDLEPADSDAQRRFWCGLFDVMSRDLDDDLARCLHATDRGYGRLVAKLPVVPTGLRRPFDELVCASSIRRFTDKALADANVLHATRNWRSAKQLKNQMVASEVATQLRKVGFGNIQPITLSDLLRTEIGADKHIDMELATQLGQVISLDAIENEKGPLHQEQPDIHKATSQARFLAKDDTWRLVKDLSSKHGSSDERLRCDFAPDHALLHEAYGDDSLEFFKVARMRSGYSPSVHLLREWVDSVSIDDQDERRRRAVLTYLKRGQQGQGLAQSLRDALPTWLKDVLENISSHPLLEGWADEKRKNLVVRLNPERIEFALPVQQGRMQPATSDVSDVLEKLHEWWKTACQNERSRYATSIYPEEFDPARLSQADDRVAWFTMFALACYQLLGRTQDGQHRNFIEDGWREGWWTELAQSEPPDGVQPWLDRLARWSAADRFDQTYHQWERTLVDLYTIARWLKVYVELFLTFPRIVTEHNHLPPLDTILRPSDSPVVQRLGLDATPIDRSLGIGANWLIRELSRNGVYDASNAKLMAPYCWTPSWRVRSLLKEINPDLHLTADNDASPVIHNFMIEHLDAERALFDGDFDLPLQIITRKRHRNLLIGWFEDAGLETPEFEDESEDDEN